MTLPRTTFILHIALTWQRGILEHVTSITGKVTSLSCSNPMGIPFSRSHSFSFAHWHLSSCSLNDRIYTSKYCNPKMGMCEACLLSMEWACLPCTEAAIFPGHAELHLFIQCLFSSGRTQSSQVLAPIPSPASAALWAGLQLCCQFMWQIIFKTSHCTCN